MSGPTIWDDIARLVEQAAQGDLTYTQAEAVVEMRSALGEVFIEMTLANAYEKAIQAVEELAP